MTLLLFCGILLSCILLHVPILWALAAGLCLFWAYGRKRGFRWGQLLQMSLSGMAQSKNILLVFLLIGMLTALWRACGTVPLIICETVGLIGPHTVLLMSFLLNCAVSMLTGTAFGTAATMGVICMTMAVSLGVNPVLAGGAVLSGAFFGDRCSPVSTSALLVSELTGTSIFANIRRMLHSAGLPFLLACAAYTVLGMGGSSGGRTPDLRALFAREFVFHWSMLLPAAVILLLSLCRVRVKMAMLVSIAAGMVVCLWVRRQPVWEVLQVVLLGYHASDPQVAGMMDGGGVVSMLQVTAIVCISSAYAGIFQQTGLLSQVKRQIARLSERITPYGGTLVTAAFSSMVACNQTLAILLTHQLCGDLEADAACQALNLEDTAVVVAPLIPWSIACAVPLTSAGAPLSSVLAACFLYLLPACRLLGSLLHRGRGRVALQWK